MTILSSCEGEKSKKKKDNEQDKYEKEIKDPCDILDYSIEILPDDNNIQGIASGQLMGGNLSILYSLTSSLVLPL